MFNLFSISGRLAGLEIRPGKIRFAEVSRGVGPDRITSYGEADIDGDGPDSGAFHLAMKDVKRVLKTHRLNISVYDMSLAASYEKSLRSVGFKVSKILPASQALQASIVPTGSETSFAVVNAEKDSVDFMVYAPTEKPLSFAGDPANHAIISNLNHIYIDWYDTHKEKIHHVVFSGERASDHDLLDYVSRETNLHIHRANIFVNLNMNPENIPIITKGESYKYAVAIGLAIS